MWELIKTFSEVIKSIPVIQQSCGCAFQKSIRAKIFPDQAFMRSPCNCYDLEWDCCNEGTTSTLVSEKDSVGVCVTNDRNEIILLEKIELYAWVKKTFFAKKSLS